MKIIRSKSTGERIRKARKQAGMTQAELASTIEMDPAVISRWENGKYEPYLPHIRRLAKALGVTAGYLIG